MIYKVILVLVGSIVFPAVGYYLDWRARKKGTRRSKL